MTTPPSRERPAIPELLQALYDAVPQMILVTDERQRIRFSNGTATRLLCAEPETLRGQPLASVLDGLPELGRGWPAATFWRIDGPHAQNSGTAQAVVTAQLRDGSRRRLRWNCLEQPGEPPSYLWWCDPRDAPDPHVWPTLTTADVLAAVHDAKGVLGIVQNYANAALIACQDEPLQRYLQQILIASQRAAEIVLQLAVGTTTTTTRPPLPAAPLLRQSIELLRASRTYRINYRASLPDNVATHCSAAQWDSLVLNLGWNACEATGDRHDTISIEVGERTLTESCTAIPEPLSAGRYVCLEVTDQGPGIPCDPLLQGLFAPFVSSKPTSGEIRGLGLFMVQSIVRSLQGGVQADTAAPTGTKFRVLIPVAATEGTR